MRDLMRIFLKQLKGEEGQGLAEYSLVIAFVAVVCVVAVTALGVAILGPFTDVLTGF